MKEEVQCVKQFICDSLTAAEVPFEIEPMEENPDTLAISSLDKDGYENVGFFGWGKDGMSYAAYDPIRGTHDEMEGVPEEDSKCWWSPKDADMMAAFLRGDVRRLMRKTLKMQSNRS